MSLEWMAWTAPTAIFFVAIGLMLAAMTLWQVKVPTIARRGLLPIETTRGDRLFVGLLGSAYIHLAWIGLTDANLWIAVAISLVWMAAVIRTGIGVTAFFCFMFSWVELLLARTLTTTVAKPIAATMTRTVSATGLDWGLLAAAGILTIVPGALVIWFVRNYLAKGFALGRV